MMKSIPVWKQELSDGVHAAPPRLPVLLFSRRDGL